MTLTDNQRKSLISIKVQKCKAALEDVLFLINDDRLSAAANRIYYAGFYIVSALALKDSIQTKTHGKLIGWFNKEYIKSNILDKELGRTLQTAFDLRMEEDYSEISNIEKKIAEGLYTEMENFVKQIRSLINIEK
jgi:uncharacterized protein